MTPTLTFDRTAAESVVQTFGRDVDEEGYIIDPETGDQLTADSGKEIHIDHFAGVEKGSILFLDDDVNTLIEHVKRRQEE